MSNIVILIKLMKQRPVNCNLHSGYICPKFQIRVLELKTGSLPSFFFFFTMGSHKGDVKPFFTTYFRSYIETNQPPSRERICEVYISINKHTFIIFQVFNLLLFSLKRTLFLQQSIFCFVALEEIENPNISLILTHFPTLPHQLG